MPNTRSEKRIPCDALGFLQLGEERLGLQTLNVSRHGACLRTGLTAWATIEDLDRITGRLNMGGQDFNFTARICWSAMEEEHVRFGVEFVETDGEVLEGVLESMSILEEPAPTDTFNL